MWPLADLRRVHRRCREQGVHTDSGVFIRMLEHLLGEVFIRMLEHLLKAGLLRLYEQRWNVEI